MEMLHRSALGRSGHLGFLYDFRTDTFTGDSILGTRLDSENDIYLTEWGNTTVQLLMSDSLEDKFHHFGIEAELSVSILCGLVKVSGSGKFLEERLKTAKSSSMSLIYKVTTITEQILPRHLAKNIDFDALNSFDATHVLTSVDWGARCTVTAEYQFSDENEKKNIEGNLKAEFNKLKGALNVSGKAELDYKDKSLEKIEKFKFFSKCDVGNRDQNLPVTFEEAIEQAKSLPSLVKKTNEGKGVPLRFIFTPLSSVRRCFKQEAIVNVVYQTIKESTLKRVVGLAQQMSDTKQKLADLQNVVKKGKECVPEIEIEKMSKLVRSFLLQEADFREQLQILLKGIRSTKKDISELESLISEFESSENSPVIMDKEMMKWDAIIEKIVLVEKTEKLGIQYFGRKENVDSNANEEVYIFYTDKMTVAKSYNLFLRLHNSYKDNDDICFCIKDLSVNHESSPKDDKVKNKITYYKGGKILTDDVEEEYGKDDDVCMMKFEANKFYKNIPNNRGLVDIRCPSECSSDAKAWQCFECKERIYYGIKTKKFYCIQCKKQCDQNATLYRCNEHKHGLTDFVKYNNDILVDELSRIRATKYVNILILGETGVGKSTWINSFANYLYFDSLQSAIEASKHKTIAPIPSKFTFTKDGETNEIKIGREHQNEDHTVGAANTQGARTYPFNVHGCTINLIDTPGIGDTRGSKQDDKNMDNILAHLTHYDEIHGILLLLKPNDARLGIMFKHCIQQLLVHLHNDAAKNISFVFTNTRSTFYEPGETLPTLRKLLKDKKMRNLDAVKTNIFCYDNEAFRLLACILNGKHFESSVMALYQESWKKAVNETDRLLQHIISDTTPHKVKNTTSLNDARRVIVELSRPLQEFTEVIQKNQSEIELMLKEGVALNNEAKLFRGKLKFVGVSLELQSLDKPMTVCMLSSCNENVQVGKDKIEKSICSKICCEGCTLGWMVTADVQGASGLWFCEAFKGLRGVCKICNHKYKYHMHRTYSLIRTKKIFKSDEVQSMLTENLSRQETIELEKQNMEILLQELREEGKIIQDIAARFAAFLKTYAIIPVDDSMGDYIDMQIKQEEEKPREDRKVGEIEALTQYKQQYEKRKYILIEAMAKVKDTDQGKADAAQSIKDLREKAFQMKHFGEEMKRVYTEIQIEKDAMPSYAAHPPQPPPQNHSKNCGSSLASKLWKQLQRLWPEH